MKFGIRKRSFKKSFSARTTGKAKRKLKRMTNPFYGKKGAGWIKNPKKALYGKVYNKTSISSKKAYSALGWIFILPLAAFFQMSKYLLEILWWLCKATMNAVISLFGLSPNIRPGAQDQEEEGQGTMSSTKTNTTTLLDGDAYPEGINALSSPIFLVFASVIAVSGIAVMGFTEHFIMGLCIIAAGLVLLLVSYFNQ